MHKIYKCNLCEFTGKKSELIEHVKDHKLDLNYYFAKYFNLTYPVRCITCNKELNFTGSHFGDPLRNYGFGKFCSNKCLAKYKFTVNNPLKNKEAKIKLSKFQSDKYKSGTHNFIIDESKNLLRIEKLRQTKKLLGYNVKRRSAPELYFEEFLNKNFSDIGEIYGDYKIYLDNKRRYLDILFIIHEKFVFNIEVDGKNFHNIINDLELRDKLLYKNYNILTLRIDSKCVYSITPTQLMSKLNELLRYGPYWNRYNNSDSIYYWKSHNDGQINPHLLPQVV